MSCFCKLPEGGSHPVAEGTDVAADDAADTTCQGCAQRVLVPDIPTHVALSNPATFSSHSSGCHHPAPLHLVFPRLSLLCSTLANRGIAPLAFVCAPCLLRGLAPTSGSPRGHPVRLALSLAPAATPLTKSEPGLSESPAAPSWGRARNSAMTRHLLMRPSGALSRWRRPARVPRGCRATPSRGTGG